MSSSLPQNVLYDPAVHLPFPINDISDRRPEGPNGLKLEPGDFEMDTAANMFPEFGHLQNNLIIDSSPQFDSKKNELTVTSRPGLSQEAKIATESDQSSREWMDMVLGQSSNISQFPIRLDDDVFITANQGAIQRGKWHFGLNVVDFPE